MYLCGIFCNVTRWIYHIDLDYAVVVNYNALIWSIKAIVPLSQGLYNTSALTGLQLNPTSTYPSDYFLGRSLNASKPGDVIIIHQPAFSVGNIKQMCYLFLQLSFILLLFH